VRGSKEEFLADNAMAAKSPTDEEETGTRFARLDRSSAPARHGAERAQA